jgi:hypothetical protein
MNIENWPLQLRTFVAGDGFWIPLAECGGSAKLVVRFWRRQAGIVGPLTAASSFFRPSQSAAAEAERDLLCAAWTSRTPEDQLREH